MPLSTEHLSYSPVRKIFNLLWPAGVMPGSADVRLCWREVFLNNLPKIIVNFLEGYDTEFYLKGLIFLGQPPWILRRECQGTAVPDALSSAWKAGRGGRYLHFRGRMIGAVRRGRSGGILIYPG